MTLHSAPPVPRLIGLTGDDEIAEWRAGDPPVANVDTGTAAEGTWHRLLHSADPSWPAIHVAHPDLPAWARPVHLAPRAGDALPVLACTLAPGHAMPGPPLRWLGLAPLPDAPSPQDAQAWQLSELRLRAAGLQLLSRPEASDQSWSSLCEHICTHLGAQAAVAARMRDFAASTWTRRGDAAQSQALVRFMIAQRRRLAALDMHTDDAAAGQAERPAPSTEPGADRAAWPGPQQAVLCWLLKEGGVLRTVIAICMPVQHLHLPLLRLLHDALGATVRGLEARRRVQQLHGILSTTTDAVVTVDRQLRVRLFNAAAERMFGVAAPDILGQRFERLLPPAQRAMHVKAMRALATAELGPAPQRAVRMLTAARADGSPFPIEAAISSFGHGADLRVTAVLRDATNLRDAEMARQAEAAARAANEAKTAFMSRMSHELRTPLNAVLGFSQLLLHGASSQLDAGQSRKVQHIIDAGQHLLRLIDDVLDIGRIESGALRIRAEPVSLAQVVGEALDYVMLDATREHVNIALQGTPGEWPTVTADATRLRQVLLNLLDNAVKYSRPGGRITIDATRDGRRVAVEIADTGRGMTAQQLSHLFEPFNRLGRERGKVAGTGLGLALSKQLVEAMDGNIEVHSSPGAGTRVRLLLRGRSRAADDSPADAPLPERPGSAPMAAPSPTPSPPSSPPPLPAPPRGTVLYVEDNSVNLVLVDALLQQWPGVTRLLARNGAEGLRMAAQGRPDLVLLDMQLGDMHGLEFLDRLRSHPATARLRVVALSASASDADRSAARQHGVEDYWSKPLDVAQFLTELPHWLPASPAADRAQDPPGFVV